MSETDDDFKLYEETPESDISNSDEYSEEYSDINNSDDTISENSGDDYLDKLEKDKNNNGFLLNRKNKKKKSQEVINRRTQDNISSARMVVIDFLEGTTRKSEAIAYARGFIDNHYSSPSSCYIYVEPYEGSYAVEIHDGGDNRPYLPNVLKSLEEDPLSCICIQNRRRVLEIKRNERGVLSSVLLPEGIDSTETNIVRVYPSDNDKMIPYAFNSLSVSLFGISFGIISFSFLLLISIVCLFLYEKPVKVIPVTEVNRLPIQNWDSLMSNYSNEAYVDKLTYDGKTWSISTKTLPKEKIISSEDIIPTEITEEVIDIKEDLGIKEPEEIEESKALIKDNIEEDISNQIIFTNEEIKEESEEMPPLEELDTIENLPSIETLDMIKESEKDSVLNPADIDDPMEREKVIREKMLKIRGINSEN